MMAEWTPNERQKAALDHARSSSYGHTITGLCEAIPPEDAGTDADRLSVVLFNSEAQLLLESLRERKDRGALAALPLPALMNVFGQMGYAMRRAAHGISTSPVVTSSTPKSISRETTVIVPTSKRTSVSDTAISTGSSDSSSRIRSSCSPPRASWQVTLRGSWMTRSDSS